MLILPNWVNISNPQAYFQNCFGTSHLQTRLRSDNSSVSYPDLGYMSPFGRRLIDSAIYYINRLPRGLKCLQVAEFLRF